MESTDEIRQRARQQLRDVFADVMRGKSSEGNSIGLRSTNFRFGIGMLVLAVFTAVIGVYPTGTFNSVMFLVFAVILALIGAYFIDRSTRPPRTRGPLDEATPDVVGVRRVK